MYVYLSLSLYIYIYTHTHIHTHTYIHMCMCVYVCVYVCVYLSLYIYIYTHAYIVALETGDATFETARRLKRQNGKQDIEKLRKVMPKRRNEDGRNGRATCALF